MSTLAHIAFIGLGHMGGPMAANLVKAGYTVTGFDVQDAALQRVVAEGVHAAASAQEAVARAEAVVSMLPASRHVESLYLAPDGVLPLIPAGALVLECSTIAPALARRLHEAACARGLDLLDAPVSGGTTGAAAATLTFIIGGRPEIVERARPLLLAMGTKLLHAGDAGAGQVAKICNNMLLAVQMIGTAEALSLGVANGLDARTLSAIMQASSGNNWSLDRYNPWPGVMEDVPASRDYSGGFGVDLMLKDLGLAMEAALATGSGTPLGALVRQLYALHSSSGHGKLDFSSIVRLLQGDGGNGSPP